MSLPKAWFQSQTFYNGLNYASRSTVDAASRRSMSITSKTTTEACRLLEELTKNNYQVSFERS